MVVSNFMESRCRCSDGREAYRALKFFGQLFVKGETRAATPQKVRRFAKLIASDRLPDDVGIHTVTLLKSGEKTLEDSLAEVCRRLAMFAKSGVPGIDKWNCKARSRSRLRHEILLVPKCKQLRPEVRKLVFRLKTIGRPAGFYLILPTSELHYEPEDEVATT